MAEEATSICSICNKTADEGKKLLQCARCKDRLYCGMFSRPPIARPNPIAGKDCQSADWSTHKSVCKRQNYLLKVHLCPDDISDPQVFRTLSCPADATFEDLHEALQIAFGWASTHTYDFKVKDPVAEAANAAEHANLTKEQSMLKLIETITTTGAPPGGVPNLLRIVEDDLRGPGGVLGGKGIDFMHNGQRQHVRTPEKKSSTVKLRDVLDKPEYMDKPLEYEYDFGDCWEHAISLEGRGEGTAFFRCLDGEGHYVAEDVGSWRGWNKLKMAYRAQRPSGEQREQMRWFEQMASNRDMQGLGNGRDRIWAKGSINRRLAC